MPSPTALIAALSTVGLVAASAAPARAAFDIVINPNATLSGNATALAAFNRAAAKWEARFTDNVTINVAAGLAGSATFTDANTIGFNQSVELVNTYNTIRDQLVADALDEPSNAIVATLPTAANFSAFVPAGRPLSGNLSITKANAKAAGFTGLDTAFGLNDATITFNSTFSFDYDNSNGVSAGQIDFEGVAIHEIGHALGFSSVVDDANAPIQVIGGNPVPALSPNTLDLFRFAGTTAVNAVTFATGPRNFVPGVEAVTSDAFNAYRMSTGLATTNGGTIGGDGNQASHFKDNLGIGIMDPTFSFTELGVITAADIRAFDLIGWDVNAAFIPEPTTLAALGGLAVAGLRRRRETRA